MSRLKITIASIAIAPPMARESAPASVPAPRLLKRPRAKRVLTPLGGVSRRGRVLASPVMLRHARLSAEKRRGPAEASPQQLKPRVPRLDRLDVYGLGTLVALLRVVGDLGALLQRAIALAVDPGVVYNEV